MNSQTKAFEKMADFLSRRDHSEKELREKLSKKFEAEVIQHVLTRAKELNLLPDEQLLSERVTKELVRKGKGSKYIRQYLAQKGLPPSHLDSGELVGRAKEVLLKRFSNPQEMDQRTRQKAFRFLASKGYSADTLRKVFDEVGADTTSFY